MARKKEKRLRLDEETWRRLEELADALNVDLESAARIAISGAWAEIRGGEVVFRLEGGPRRRFKVVSADDYLALRERLRTLMDKLSELERVSRVVGRSGFVDALEENGLLHLAAVYLRGESRELEDYIYGDDAYVALYRYRDEILSRAAESSPKPYRKHMTWIF